MSNSNLTAQREHFEAMMEMPIANQMIRQEGLHLFAHDLNGREWTVKVTRTGKIKKNSLRRGSY